MDSIIKKIYFKELGYFETAPKNEEYAKATEAYFQAHEKLDKALNEEQRKMLAELYDCDGAMERVSEYLSFENGFRAGILLGMELCKESE